MSKRITAHQLQQQLIRIGVHVGVACGVLTPFAIMAKFARDSSREHEKWMTKHKADHQRWMDKFELDSRLRRMESDIQISRYLK